MIHHVVDQETPLLLMLNHCQLYAYLFTTIGVVLAVREIGVIVNAFVKIEIVACFGLILKMY